MSLPRYTYAFRSSVLKKLKKRTCDIPHNIRIFQRLKVNTAFCTFVYYSRNRAVFQKIYTKSTNKCDV